MEFIKGLFGTATSFLGGAKVWLIVLAVSNAATGVYFYNHGVDHVVTKVINASDAQIAAATAVGAQAQQAIDAKDAAKNKADYEARLAAADKRNAALDALLKNAKLMVPRQPGCKPITAAAMDKLNDPDLIGKDAQ